MSIPHCLLLRRLWMKHSRASVRTGGLDGEAERHRVVVDPDGVSTSPAGVIRTITERRR
jgi:hypothetical protein